MAINLSGSLILTGSITTTGGITISGSIASASFAGDAALFAGKPVTVFPTTGSNTFVGSQTITGSVLQSGSLSVNGCIVSTGQIIAQTINVQQVTSSVVYSCGSNIFGCAITDVQQMTGSVRVTGSLNTVGSICSTMTNASCVGIGTTTPSYNLHIQASSPRIWMVDSTLNGSCFEVAADTTSVGIYNRSNLPLVLGTNNTTRLTIAATGGATFTCGVTAENLNINSISTSPVGLTITSGDETFIKFMNGVTKNWGFITTNLAGSDFGIYQSNAVGGDPFTAGVPKLYFNGSGNVGIGTSSPSSLLDTLANSSGGNLLNSTADVVARFGNCHINPGNHYSSGIQVFQGCGTLGSGYAAGFLTTDNNTATAQQSNTVSLISPSSMTGGINVIAADSSASIRMFTGGFTCERLRINSTGNIGIGTTSLSTEANLFLGNQGSGAANEGGQLVLQKASSCHCATHLDNYQNSFRVMSGTDTGSTAVNMVIDHRTLNACFYGYTMSPKYILNGTNVNGAGYAVCTFLLSAHIESTTQNILTLGDINSYTTAVAHIDWTENYALAGNNMTIGYTIAGTRRGSNNTVWVNSSCTLLSLGDAPTPPTFAWSNGSLQATVAGSHGVNALFKITVWAATGTPNI